MIQLKPEYLHQQMALIVQAIQAGMANQELITYVQNIEKRLSEQEDPEFNYDLERIKKHVESESITVLQFSTPEELDK
ncbi:hypothetical protein NYR60_05775 [Actinobacillus genomosp. 2]|uniref:hypothetical protein n=1 Tax=Actinobacillus genomosp. 2 TaxID=230709 RepID=UPI00244172A1|nr:hypothetical protein [Actinobacillus genomosp. 2]WGE31383.1 hypothetical protein NYR60_05775 [Actinobacillus genomosp. 2]